MGRFLLGIFMILIGGFAIWWLWWQDFDIERRLKDQGAETYGTVIKRDLHEHCPSEDSDCTTQYRVKYNFVARNGRGYEGTATVPRALYDRLEIGSKLTVTYLSDDPRVSHLEGQESSIEWLWLIAGGAVMFAGVFVSYRELRG